jgi:hypothetical protein
MRISSVAADDLYQADSQPVPAAQAALGILRELCSSVSTSWTVSDVQGWVTLLDVWQTAIEERLGLEPEDAQAVMAGLIDAGDAVNDYRARVYPRVRRP